MNQTLRNSSSGMPHVDVLLDELPIGQPTRLEVGAAGAVVIRTGDQVAAFEDVCPHAKYRLSSGEIVGGLLECPGHGWEFSITTGQCVTEPSYCLRPLNVQILDARVVRVFSRESALAAVPLNATRSCAD